MLYDYIMEEEAEARMTQYDPDETMSRREVMESFGITDDDLDDVVVEIE